MVRIVILPVCVALHIECVFKIVDERSYAYEYLHTPELPGLRSSSLPGPFP